MPRTRDVPLFRHPRTGIWQLRRTIPTGLRQHFIQANGKPKAELSPVSLGTRDERQATKAAAQPWASHLSLLDALRRGRPHTGEAKRYFRQLFEREEVEEVTSAVRQRAIEIAALEAQITALELQLATDSAPENRREEIKRKLRVKRMHDSQLRLRELRVESGALIGLTQSMIEDLTGSKRGDGAVESALSEFVEEYVHHHPHPLGDPQAGEMARRELTEIARTEAIAAQNRLLARLSGTEAVANAPQPAGTLANATDETPPLTVREYYDEVFRRGRTIKSRRGEPGLSPSGLDKALEGARDFTDIMGQLRLAEVTPAHVREFRSVLLRVPRQWRKTREHKGKPLRSLVEEADRSTDPVPRLAPETVNSTLSGLSIIYGYAVENGHVASNPLSGIRAEVATDKEPDPQFEIEDLNKLFASPWFAGCASEADLRTPGDYLIRDHRYWAFLCMLFSGARVSEIGGIHIEHVHLLGEEDGFFEFDWTEGEHGRRLKNASSVRIVPIHPELIRLGFLGYARRMKEEGHERLFPGWLPNKRRIDGDVYKNEFAAASFLKRFNTYMKWLGVKRPRLSAKSFRATWETNTIGMAINERSLLKLTGRAQKGELASYLPLKAKHDQLRETVAAITYDGLDLSRLYPPT